MIYNRLLTERHVLGVILIFSFFPLLPNKFKGLSVISLLLVTLFGNVKKSVNIKELLVNSSLFIIYLFSLIYTDDYKFALSKLETGLSILVIPIIFNGFLANFKFNLEFKVKFLKLSIIFSIFFAFISLLFISVESDSIYCLNWNTDKFRNISSQLPLIGQHPIYSSIFLSTPLFFFFELIRMKVISTKVKQLFYVFLLFNVVLLFMLSSKGVIISLLSVFIISALIEFKNFKLAIAAIFILTCFFFFSRRAKELYKVEVYNEINESYSTSIRLGIYKCAFKLIESNPIFGYGIGDAQRELNLCYAYESNILLKNRFNSHNQYLDILIKTGFFGLLVFIYFILYNIRKAIKSSNGLLLQILFFYCLIFLSENILLRQSGVILFYFLIIFFNHSMFVINLKR